MQHCEPLTLMPEYGWIDCRLILSHMLTLSVISLQYQFQNEPSVSVENYLTVNHHRHASWPVCQLLIKLADNSLGSYPTHMHMHRGMSSYFIHQSVERALKISQADKFTHFIQIDKTYTLDTIFSLLFSAISYYWAQPFSFTLGS